MLIDDDSVIFVVGRENKNVKKQFYPISPCNMVRGDIWQDGSSLFSLPSPSTYALITTPG